MGSEATGMQAFVSTLTAGLSADALWGAIAPVAPIMIIVCLVAIGRRLVQKNLNSGVKGNSAKIK